MENLNDNNPEFKKEWVTPELKMVDVELVTALTSGGIPPDGGTSQFS